MAGSANPEIHIWGPPIIDWLNVSDRPKWPTDKRLKISFQQGGIYLLMKLLGEMNSTDCVRLAKLKSQDKDSKKIEIPKKDATLSPLDENFGHTWSTWRQTKENEPEQYRLPLTGITSSDFGRYLIEPPDLGKPGVGERMLVLDVLWSDLKSQKKLFMFLAGIHREQEANEKKLYRTEKTDHADLEFLKKNITKEVIKSSQSKGERPEKHFDQVVVRFNARTPSDSFIEKHETEKNLKDKEQQFLEELCEYIPREKITVVTKLKLLRETGERIGESISWEQMLDDVARAVEKRYEKVCKRVITTVGLCGAVVVTFGNLGERNSHDLVYCVGKQENDDEAELEGRVIGNSTCVVAAFATEWMLCKQHGKAFGPAAVNSATQKGVAMIRALNQSGYTPNDSTSRQHLEFPFEVVRNSFFESSGQYRKDIATFSRDEGPSKRPWTILEKNNSKNSQDSSKLDFPLDIAKEIVKKGGRGILQSNGVDPTKLFPLYHVNHWQSADRNEIELVRSVHNMLRRYVLRSRSGEETKPISIGVFGPPGSGKSFVVKQIAKKLSLDDSQLTVNLSQMESPSELAHAFQRSRNFFLQGKIPVVFWDEFDSSLAGEPLAWLRYFLSPMQDGEFLDNGILQSLGNAIFVFAGGTTNKYDAFVSDLDSDNARQAKKRDFVSRLRAYIDVKGPNEDKDSNQEDRFVPVRRAFLIHSLLQKFETITIRNSNSTPGNEVRIDDRVIDAFLKIDSFTHGARSIENIIRQSSLSGKTAFDKSSLPPRNLLKMHVDVEKFMELVGD